VPQGWHEEALPELSQSPQPGSLIGKIEAKDVQVHVTVNNITLHRETRTVNAPTTYNTRFEEPRAQYVEVLPVVYAAPSPAPYYQPTSTWSYDPPFYSPQRKPSPNLDGLFGCLALLLCCLVLLGGAFFLIGWAWHAFTATSPVPVQAKQPPATLRIEVQGAPNSFDEFLREYEKQYETKERRR
jgi:hypothetical protein